MRVQKVTIEHILGIDHLEFEPGSVTIIEGKNDVGKTSVLNAISAALGVTQDAMLLKKGETEGKIVLVLDDGVTVTKRATAGKRPTVTVRHPELGNISQPQFYLDRLADALSVKPIAFLNASPDERAEYLLETLPVKVTDTELVDAAPDLAPMLPSNNVAQALPPETANGIDRIDAASKLLYDERTGINRTAKEKRATIAQLEESLFGAPLPTEDPREIQEEAEAVAERLSSQLRERLSEIDLNERREDAEIDRIATEGMDQATKMLNEEMARAKNTFDKFKTDLVAKKEAQLRKCTSAHSTLRTDAREDLQPRIESAKENAAAAKARSERFITDKKTREFIADHRETAKALEERSEALSTALVKLDALRLAALARLPIKGLEVKAGAIFVDGIPLDQVSKAAQVKIACEIAELRAGKLGIVCLDGLEALDEETFAAFEKWGESSGKQLVVSRVTTGPLKVRTSVKEEVAS